MSASIETPSGEGYLAMHESHKGLAWSPPQPGTLEQNIHYLLKQEELEMPTPAVFMPYVAHVLGAYHKKGTLMDSLGNELTSQRKEKVYGHLISGAWSWLNARFVIYEEGFHGLGLERVVDVESDGKLVTEIEPLLACVWNAGYVDLTFNAQGMPVQFSHLQKYVPGENLYFSRPRVGTVAWFYANSGGAVLSCDGNPTDSGSCLRVFAFSRKKNPKALSSLDVKRKHLEITARDPQAIEIVGDERVVEVSTAHLAMRKALEAITNPEERQRAMKAYRYNLNQEEGK